MKSGKFSKVDPARKTGPSHSPGRFILFEVLTLLLLLLMLILADMLCYQQALPVTLDEHAGNATLHVGTEIIPLGSIGTPISLQFPLHDPVIHEYQLDGTDSTNNFTLDTTYLNSIASSPYYLFQSWMRNLDGTSRWSNLRISSNDHLLASKDWPANGETISLQSATPLSPSTTLHLALMLRRPETPMTLNLTMADNSTIQITLNRNDRQINITRNSQPLTRAFFPTDILPFAAMLIDTFLRTVAWSIVLLLAVLFCEIVLVLIKNLPPIPHIPYIVGTGLAPVRKRVEGTEHPVRSRYAPLFRTRAVGAVPCADPGSSSSRFPLASSLSAKAAVDTRLMDTQVIETVPNARKTSPLFITIWHNLTQSLHPIALLALLASLCFVSWIAYIQYHAEPHIYDASAYLFSAKMYATGHLSVPALPILDRFPGPFMIQSNGQWFAQYAPGTGLTLVPGIWLGIPWLVEPICGTLALLGIGLIAARLFDRRVATLAILLGALSPFYSYIAASYLSHAIALFYLTWGLWALLRFLQGKAWWNLPLSTFLFGMGYLTRNEPALLFILVSSSSLIILSRPRVRLTPRQWIIAAALSLTILTLFIAFTLQFNTLLTHNPFTAPRSLFFAGDHWGFGPGVGFYDQHTLAAGLVNLDELLTILAIDLYGWPFYLTLAFLALPFLTRRSTPADWFCLLSLLILTVAYIGYFYHGIYLGPRYLFETLPFLLILTARGILTLSSTARSTANNLHRHFHSNTTAHYPTFSLPTTILIISLILCNLLYYLPRQIQLHQNYTGLPTGYHVDVAAVYHPPMHNAIIVTSDYTIYQFVLFPLNDPFLRDDVIYAWASNEADYSELRTAFPSKHLYQLNIAADGSISYTPI